MQVRYDEEKQIYNNCKFCKGKGCLACPGEADKDYKKQFPDGPDPIATFKRDDPKDMERLGTFIHSLVGEQDGEIGINAFNPDPSMEF